MSDRLRLVHELERERIAKGFKPGWLYFRCQDRGLLNELRAFRAPPTPPRAPADPAAPRLSVELVPQTCWFSNVRSHVRPEDWDRLRRAIARASNYRCGVCEGQGHSWPVECHEQWLYDDERRLQILGGLIALCPDCHRVKHFGLAHKRGQAAEALATLSFVNGWDRRTAREYVDRQLEVWRERSRHEWTLDLSFLDDVGIRVVPEGEGGPLEQHHANDEDGPFYEPEPFDDGWLAERPEAPGPLAPIDPEGAAPHRSPIRVRTRRLAAAFLAGVAAVVILVPLMVTVARLLLGGQIDPLGWFPHLR